MKKVKINIDRPIPSSSNIAQAKNFDKVIGKYAWYTSLIKLSIIGSVAIVVAVALYILNPTHKNFEMNNRKIERSKSQEISLSKSTSSNNPLEIVEQKSSNISEQSQSSQDKKINKNS